MKNPKNRLKAKHIYQMKTKSSRYAIDQSGKIEQTNRATVVALANGKIITVRISAVEKQKLIKTMIELRKPNRTYSYDIFAALIYSTLDLNFLSEVEIDREYPGHEASIKERIIQLLEKNKKKIPEISFKLVGKKCNAHIFGLSVFQGKTKPTVILKAEDIIKIIFGTKKGWRPRSSRGNP